MAGFGLVGTTAPEQVIEWLEELRVLDDLSPEVRRVLAALAHLAYGVGTGTALGLLRRERGGIVEEASVGSALGTQAWGAGWFSWLTLAEVHLPLWEQQKAQRCSCRSWITPFSGPFGGFCTVPRSQTEFKCRFCSGT